MATQSQSADGLSDEPIYFRLDQSERAAHVDVNELLARDLYDDLASLIKQSLPGTGPDLDTEPTFLETRGHTAVFIDGDRGTGKTTVVVNLRGFLATPHARRRHGPLAEEVHVLKPIDPTQLEDSEDMFLNVIVAAILADSDIKQALESRPDKRQRLHDRLQRLGQALEGRESRAASIGLDRLRSFVGSQALAAAIHAFFAAALDLLGKRLLVLPIDDVDTTLHKAFDYLEVVRRYLSSALVLPLVCGDLRLYLDVTKRDALRRLEADPASRDDPTRGIASGLAVEYLRKILPIQRRLRMPDVGTFMRDERILIRASATSDISPSVSMRQFSAWMYAVLAGPVNGHENSGFALPVPTIRALAQLANSIREQFPSLEAILQGGERARPTTDLVRRLMHVATGVTVQARTAIASGPTPEPADRLQPEGSLITGWAHAMLQHFRFAPEAGAACLVLLASRHWRADALLPVLNTPLFQPLSTAAAADLRYSDRRAPTEWRPSLEGRISPSWIEDLPQHLILPFATPEIGRAVSLQPREGRNDLDGVPAREVELALALVMHRNYYSQGYRATLLYTGRILELVITSLVRQVTRGDLERILGEAPFHSLPAVARTKAIVVSMGEDESPEARGLMLDEDPAVHVREADLDALSRRLDEWRVGLKVDQLVLSPWLIYCAINKTLNQVAYFNRPLSLRRQPTPVAALEVAQTGAAAFNAFWSALASFEKGPLFGLPLVLSNVNLTLTGDFLSNPLYTQNIRPLETQAVETSTEGDQLRSITKMLKTHPVRLLLQGACETLAQSTDSEEPEVVIARRRHTSPSSRAALLRALGMPTDRKVLRADSIAKTLLANSPSNRQAQNRARELLASFEDHPGIARELATLQAALDMLRSR